MIPGLKDGMFKSPADGEWKKVKSISKVPNKKYNNEKPEAETAESAETEDTVRKVKGMKKLKSVKKIKDIIDIDDDLALKMKKEVEEGGEYEAQAQGGNYEAQEEVGADVQAKIDRILKMFNASSLDDIIEVTPIKSIQEVDPENLPMQEVHIPDDRGYAPAESEDENSEDIDTGMGLLLAKEHSVIKHLDDKLHSEVEELEKETGVLDKERALQQILKKMLAVQV